MRIKIVGKWRVNSHTGEGMILELSKEQASQIGFTGAALRDKDSYIAIRCRDNWLSPYVFCETSGNDEMQYSLRKWAFLRVWGKLGYPLSIPKQTYHYGSFSADYPHGLVKFTSQVERDAWVALDPAARATTKASDKWIRRGLKHGWVCEMADRNGPALF